MNKAGYRALNLDCTNRSCNDDMFLMPGLMPVFFCTSPPFLTAVIACFALCVLHSGPWPCSLCSSCAALACCLRFMRAVLCGGRQCLCSAVKRKITRTSRVMTIFKKMVVLKTKSPRRWRCRLGLRPALLKKALPARKRIGLNPNFAARRIG